MKSIYQATTLALVVLVGGMVGCGGGDTGGDFQAAMSLQGIPTLQELEEKVGAKSRTPTERDMAEITADGTSFTVQPGETTHVWRADNGKSWLIAHADANGRITAVYRVSKPTRE